MNFISRNVLLQIVIFKHFILIIIVGRKAIFKLCARKSIMYVIWELLDTQILNINVMGYYIFSNYVCT